MSDFDYSTRKVLVCDDDPDTMDVTRLTYEGANIGSFVATPDPEEALKLMSEIKPDLVLMAMKFDTINGIQIVQKLRSLDGGAFYKTPILMVLKKVSPNLLREACRAGIEGALRKPLSQEKILRFSRAVMLKPRRFICVRNYFGPERRMRSDPHFNGEDRRNSFKPEELNTDSYTKPLPSASSSGSTSSESLASADFTSSDKPASTASYDFGASATKGGASSNGDYDLTSTPAEKSRDIDFGVTDTKKEKSAPDDIEVRVQPNSTQEDDAIAQKKAKKKKAANKDKGTEKKEEIETAAPVEKTGPDNENYEEIIDLEECLELHKTWINSGGKTGQQANRPHSDFRGKELDDADFTGAILPQSNFEKVNCTGTVFRKADLKGSTFQGAMLSSADLRVSRLSKADLRNARMDKANLLGADLTGANLEGATLRGVNLSGANLSRTNLRGVNLASVQGLIPEQVNRAITDQATQLPLSARTSA